jgi:uncharacterized glyoxalase superfamily protein PhnB
MSYDRRENAALAVELLVPDVREAVAFYAETLGMEFLRADDDGVGGYSFAAMALGEAFVMLMADSYQHHDLTNRGAGIDIRLVVPDVDAVYRRVMDAGVEITKPIGDRDYGLRDFTMRDPNGFR